MKFFNIIEKAHFLSRPNRFVVYCSLQGKKRKAFLPNPGRLQELLFPGVTLYLEKSLSTERTMPYTVVAVERDGDPVVLHTHLANSVVRRLVEAGRIPGLEGTQVVRAEVTMGNSRFDFLLRKNRQDLYVEVKSCTLFSRKMAMFPDAVTTRGRKHVEELATLSRKGDRGVVLFLVHSPKAKYFLPEYHTDLEFAKTLWRARKKVTVIPLAVRWKKDLALGDGLKVLPIPWEIVEREAEDRGSYLLILDLKRARTLKIGKLGTIHFKKGYYLYVGSAQAHLSKRVQRHQRLRKKMFWHIDYLRQACRFHAALPVLTGDDLECTMTAAFKKVADEEIPGFGSSDCKCPSHLFRMREDPLDTPAFHENLQYFRMDRLVEKLKN